MSVPPRPVSRWPGPAAVLRAVVSAVVLAAVVLALPVVLGWATPLLWANGQDALTHLLTRPDSSGSGFVLVLLGVAWVAWAQFAACVVVEVVAQARGRTVRPLRGFAFGQRAAAALISSIVVLLPTGTAMAAPVAAHATTAHALPGSRHHASPTPATAPDSTAGHDDAAATSGVDGTAADHGSYTLREVRPAESLWSIAVAELGDGERWEEIARANVGRTMGDGQTFRADGFLQPGWRLRLPAAPAAHAADAGTTPRSVTVRSGQTLSQIAQEQLGDADQYPDIFQANRGERQPGGGHFTDPDLIYPGQHLDLPAPTTHEAPHPRQPAEGTPHTRAPEQRIAPPTRPSPTTPATPPTTAPTPKADGGAHTAPRPPAAPTPQASERTQHAPATPQTGATSPVAESFDIRRLAGIGALLAASIIGALAVKRILQQRRRRPGETIAMPAEASQVEQALAVGGEPASVLLLDSALRTLHHYVLARDDVDLPQVRGARVTGRTVELLPEEHGAPPLAPFVAGADGWWRLPEDAELLSDEEAQSVAAPWPGLVTIGTTPEGDLLLLNLPHTGTVLLDGSETDVRSVARAIAMEAATCTWADRTEILTIGLGDDLAEVLPQGRIRAVPHLRAAARDLGELLLEHHQAADDTQPLPWLLICAAAAHEEEAWELADAVAAARQLPVALVLPAVGTAGCYPEAEPLDAADTEAQDCAALSSPVIVQRVGDADYAQIVADLRVADEPARPAEGPWRHVPDNDEDPAHSEPVPATMLEQAMPFASLAASVHLLPHPTAQDGIDSNTPASEGAGAPGAVIQLVKQIPATVVPEAGPAAGMSSPLDEEAPLIEVLGPVTVTGIAPSGHGPKLAGLAVLLYFRPRIDVDALCEAMSPRAPWSKRTLQARVSELRSRLGSNAEGELYLPRDRAGGYRLSPAVRCDWQQFQDLAERGLTLGPERGVGDLEQALTLVRGRPLGGGDHAWAAPLMQEMLSRIVDVAHTIAVWRRTGPVRDLDAARRAVTAGLAVDETAEVLYRDWMSTEQARGSRDGVHRAIEALQGVNHRLDVGMEPETEEVIEQCLAAPSRVGAL